VWVRKDMTLRKPDGRGKGVTVLGAISEKQGLVHYSILESTNNAITFSNFVSELVRKIKGEAYVYMDNLSVHTANSVKSHFNERVHQRFLPPYSCSLNPIERLWHVTKMKWKRLMLEKPEIIQNDADLVREVKKIMEDAKPQCANLASSHVEHMVRSLRGDFV
jgi:transposase